MTRSIGLVALLGAAVLTLLAVLGVTRPIRVELVTGSETREPFPVVVDGGSLDSVLDAVRIDHALKHGR